ncbi:MAG: folylpolyglutamate synthase/dihydrofolate synthase family protein [Terriglobales bacterium]
MAASHLSHKPLLPYLYAVSPRLWHFLTTGDERPTTNLSYETAVAQMYALGHELASTPAHKFDLAHMRVLLAALGNPERAFPSVLVAGTNGKGSTSATLAAILRASGLKTGLYTSPHLVRINERIRLDGAAITDDDFALLHDVVDRTADRLVSERDLPWHPSFFEMLTAIAFEYFARSRPDVAVLEVGMGGRLDATNVVEPRVSVITDISLDHQKYLGETVREIAGEKAGIIRRGGVVVTLPQMPEANDVIGHAILDLGARAVNAVPYVPPVSPGSGAFWHAARKTLTAEGAETSAKGAEQSLRQRYPLAVMGEEIVVDSPLVGRHQLRNLALAIAAAVELREQGFSSITAVSIERGIRETRWPGRFQVVPAGAARPEMVLDVAHNPAGAWALRAALSAQYEGRPVTMVFGVLRDKAIAEMTEILFPIAERVIVTHADNPRSAGAEEIRQAARRVSAEISEAENVAAALALATGFAGPDGLVVVTGSIYIIGEAMRVMGIGI